MDNKELSKDEIIYLLKKEIENNLILIKENNDLKEKYTKSITQWNNFQLNNNVSSVNAWLAIKEFFETDKSIQNYYKDTCEELIHEQCYNTTTHMITTIQKLLDYIPE